MRANVACLEHRVAPCAPRGVKLHLRESGVSRHISLSGFQTRWAHGPQVCVPSCTNAKSCNVSPVTKFDLRREDCIAGMPRLADGSIDLVVTSPPYNLGISYGQYSD